MPGRGRGRLHRERLNLAAQRAFAGAARRCGWHVVRADFYSPIVEPGRVPAQAWERRAPMHGVTLDLERQLQYVEQVLAPLAAQWRPPLDPPGDELGFHLRNPFYGPLDAELLYAFVRALRPRRVLELGSGFSTLAIERAAADTDRDGVPRPEHTVVDPFPSSLVTGLERIALREVAAETLELSTYTALEPGDILFVDTSHTVRIAGDVVFLVLEVLPALAPGVIVHFHDIYRPFEYPRPIVERFNKHWQEHHLLEAFLAYNPCFRVLCANHALARLHLWRMQALAPDLRAGMVPSGFWLEKRS